MSFSLSQNFKEIQQATALLSPSQNMQFCNGQTWTQPLFSPACLSGIYGSARMNNWRKLQNSMVCIWSFIIWIPLKIQHDIVKDVFLIVIKLGSDMTSHSSVVNSSPPSAANWRQWTGSTLVQVMACCLLSYCQLDSWEQILVKF